MAELDKKIQKAQTDLVQAVLEAQERRNVERVDMLVTNAFKQLKMSRFKPDQTTCISLTYLAKISPQVFSQSAAIKDVLKSLLRRDNGPTNIKGKNDIILPVLSANILLACCDGSDVRTIILNKIEQWLSANQKITELMQHLLATLCMKCQNDQQTTSLLTDMRHYWMQYLEDNFHIYGSVPVDLCHSIRELLHVETSCENLILYLRFLLKHDLDIQGLSDEVGRFIIERPISLNSMQNNDEDGILLNKLILKVYIKLFAHLKKDQTEAMQVDETKTTVSDIKSEIKQEPQDIKPSLSNLTAAANIVKSEPVKMEPQNKNDDIDSNSGLDSQLYLTLPDSKDVVELNRTTAEAVLTLLSVVNVETDIREEYCNLLENWVVDGKIKHISPMFEDFALTRPYSIPHKLRQKLIYSSNDLLVELGLHNASIEQLIKLLQHFGSSISTINKILSRLEVINDINLIRNEINNISYFNELLMFYSSMGIVGAQKLKKQLDSCG